MISGSRIDDIIEPAKSRPFTSYRLEKLKGINNSPTGGGINPDISFIFSGNLGRKTIPGQKALLEIVYLLDKRLLDMKASFGYGFSNWLTKLGNDHLLGLVYRIQGAAQNNQTYDNHH
ncbi:hypothetical protein ES703_55384 [subsurface metagenome]